MIKNKRQGFSILIASRKQTIRNHWSTKTESETIRLVWQRSTAFNFEGQGSVLHDWPWPKIRSVPSNLPNISKFYLFGWQEVGDIVMREKNCDSNIYENGQCMLWSSSSSDLKIKQGLWMWLSTAVSGMSWCSRRRLWSRHCQYTYRSIYLYIHQWQNDHDQGIVYIITQSINQLINQYITRSMSN